MNKLLQFSNVINLLCTDPVAVYFSGKEVFYEKMCSKFFFLFFHSLFLHYFYQRVMLEEEEAILIRSLF